MTERDSTGGTGSGKLLDGRAEPRPVYLRRPAVKARYGIGDSTLYRWIRDGRFPPPVQLGPQAVGWRVSDLEAWERSRPVAAKRGAA